MIPLAGVIPSRTVPVVTIAIAGFTAAAFLCQQTLPDAVLRQTAASWGLTPAAGAWPAVLSSTFLHAGWLHVLATVGALWIFGDNVEDRLGHARFAIFYVLCGGIAGLAQIAAAPGSAIPTVGAGGAVAGVIGGHLVLYPRSRVLTLVFPVVFVEIVELPATLVAGVWLVLQLVIGTMPVDAGGAAGHGPAALLAGAAAGALLVRLLARRDRARVEWWHDGIDD